MANESTLMDGWFFHLPEFFREALRRREFRSGDIIYNSAGAYRGCWMEGVRSVQWALQVIEGQRDWQVRFNLYRGDQERPSGLRLVGEITTQMEEFLSLLEFGPEQPDWRLNERLQAKRPTRP